jgi:hypothetical protein
MKCKTAIRTIAVLLWDSYALTMQSIYNDHINDRVISDNNRLG